MTIYIIILSVILLFSAISKAIMDTVGSCFSSSVFKNLNPLFWDKVRSWRNKWKGGEPAKGEKFLGSSTIFVSFTDAWHLFQHFFLLFLFLSLVLYSQCFPIITWKFWYITDFIIIYVYFTSISQITYWLLNKK